MRSAICHNKQMYDSFNSSVKTYIKGVQKNHLIETYALVQAFS